MHAAKDDSPRLAKLLRVLQAHKGPGITTFEIQQWTNSCAPATDISELRRNGYEIERVYQGKNENGRQVNRYYLKGRLDV
jgi:hypothetical protein